MNTDLRFDVISLAQPLCPRRRTSRLRISDRHAHQHPSGTVIAGAQATVNKDSALTRNILVHYVSPIARILQSIVQNQRFAGRQRSQSFRSDNCQKLRIIALGFEMRFGSEHLTANSPFQPPAVVLSGPRSCRRRAAIPYRYSSAYMDRSGSRSRALSISFRASSCLSSIALIQARSIIVHGSLGFTVERSRWPAAQPVRTHPWPQRVGSAAQKTSPRLECPR